ncbi:MAG: hypothetical protein MH252_07535 [Thermosynechococcaceae cyanobacterium MS004]|nr:hypothetical protein [Thermosynechococcaceae cyanobacterium MS004]MCG9890911.1 hypothetical protein [Thermosynechococcaceae cyanobacterium MS004]
MAAKNSLADGLRSLSNKPSPQISPVENAVTLPEGSVKGKHYRPSRDGTRAITAHADPAVSKQIRQLALDEDTSVQALVHEALNLLFEKYGKPQIAPDRFKA